MLGLLDRGIELRPALPDDLDFAWQVYASGLRPYLSAYRPWDDADQCRRFARIFDPAHSAIVQCDGTAAGFVTIEDSSRAILLQQFFLGREWRGRGIGGGLLARLCTVWDDLGRPASLAVLKNNPARHLYRRHGFTTYWRNDDRFFMLREPRPA